MDALTKYVLKVVLIGFVPLFFIWIIGLIGIFPDQYWKFEVASFVVIFGAMFVAIYSYADPKL